MSVITPAPLRVLRDVDASWIAFWPTLRDGTTAIVFWHHISAILPSEVQGAGATIVLSGGRTIHVIEARETIERALFP